MLSVGGNIPRNVNKLQLGNKRKCLFLESVNCRPTAFGQTVNVECAKVAKMHFLCTFFLCVENVKQSDVNWKKKLKSTAVTNGRQPVRNGNYAGCETMVEIWYGARVLKLC